MEYRVVTLMDAFVAQIYGDEEEYRRIDEDDEVYVGFKISEEDLEDNKKEKHFSDWEDDEFDYYNNDDDDEGAIDFTEMFSDFKGVEYLLDVDNKEKEENIFDTELIKEDFETAVERDNEALFTDDYCQESLIECVGFVGVTDQEKEDKDVPDDAFILKDTNLILYEPPYKDGTSKNMSWSETEWYDIKQKESIAPVIVDDDISVEYPSQFNVKKIEKVRDKEFVDYSRYSYDYAYDSASAYGYFRMGDLLFKLLAPFSVRKNKDVPGFHVIASAIAGILPVEKRGLLSYVLLPHDRIFFLACDFRKKKEWRITVDLDLDLVERFKIFSKTRLTQYYVGGNCYGEITRPINFTIVPSGKVCDWIRYPYMIIDKGGTVSGMLDVGFPPFWNRSLKMDLVFYAEDGNMVFGGYVKFWLTHLFRGTQCYEPVVESFPKRTHYSKIGENYVVNPLMKNRRRYNSGFTSMGVDIRVGSYRKYKDILKESNKKNLRSVYVNDISDVDFFDIESQYDVHDKEKWKKFRKKYFPGFGGT